MDNQESENIIEEKTFAEMMAETPPEKDRLRPGQKVQAVIL